MRGFKSKIDVGSRAYARHDMTFRQRAEDRALRAELKTAREDYPDLAKDLVIRDWEIFNKATNSVFRPPRAGHVQSQPVVTVNDDNDGLQPRRSMRASQTGPSARDVAPVRAAPAGRGRVQGRDGLRGH